MVKLVEDGKARYLAADQTEINDRYARRVAEIKDAYTVLVRGNILKRCTQHVLMLREMARAKRGIFGKDNLYLTPLRDL